MKAFNIILSIACVALVCCVCWTLGYYCGQNSLRIEAVANGAARWEIKSQKEPRIVLAWSAVQ